LQVLPNYQTLGVLPKRREMNCVYFTLFWVSSIR